MRKSTLLNFALFMLCAQVASAQELSPFNTQDVSYDYPDNMNNYIATKAPVAALDNHYFGLSIGAAAATAKFNNTYTITDTSQTSVRISKNCYDIQGGIFGGYGTNFDHFYLAGEVGGYYSTLSSRIHDNTTNPTATTYLSIKQPAILTFDVLPGFLTDDRSVLLYGRLGIGASLVQLKINADSGDPTNPIDQTSNKFAPGLRLGAGIEYFFVDAFSMRAEYVFSQYGEVKDSVSVTTPTTLKYSYDVKPRFNQINLGFNFHF